MEAGLYNAWLRLNHRRSDLKWGANSEFRLRNHHATRAPDPQIWYLESYLYSKLMAEVRFNGPEVFKYNTDTFLLIINLPNK